ncbi:MAG: Zn-dependent hydrolase, partial [Bacteroidales bacterium]|nr:Zn-dependent hydrolase [Bacteroidales bacterium]
MKHLFFISASVLMLFSCKQNPKIEDIRYYAGVELKTDISNLSDNEKQLLTYLFDAAELMDSVFWKQAYLGKRDALFAKADSNPELSKFIEINYGPWERLNNNLPFVEGFGAKPKGAAFYPPCLTAAEFEKMDDPAKTSLYTIIRCKAGHIPYPKFYHDAYAEEFTQAAEYLRKAAELAEDPAFAKYLKLRADALLSDDYYESDMAWMDVLNSKFDIVIGPIENYEDALYGYKAACESFVLIKDFDWSKKLDKFAAMLPDLQKALPTGDVYKAQMPGSESVMAVYDAVLYRGDCNAGSKTIAINLPNDERIHVQKGTRKLMLKNSMKYKFDKIMAPISEVVMDKSQLKHVKFDAFFENVTFHEVAHGMGIKNTVTTGESLRASLKENYSTIEETKADIMGLWLVGKLREKGEITEGEMLDNYTTFFAGIFRSVRFGAASAHGRANMLCFNHFMENGVFTRSAEGIYKVNYDKMSNAVNSLIDKILTVQGNGDYETAKQWIAEKSQIGEILQTDLDRIAD